VCGGGGGRKGDERGGGGGGGKVRSDAGAGSGLDDAADCMTRLQNMMSRVSCRVGTLGREERQYNKHKRGGDQRDCLS